MKKMSNFCFERCNYPRKRRYFLDHGCIWINWKYVEIKSCVDLPEIPSCHTTQYGEAEGFFPTGTNDSWYATILFVKSTALKVSILGSIITFWRSADTHKVEALSGSSENYDKLPLPFSHCWCDRSSSYNRCNRHPGCLCCGSDDEGQTSHIVHTLHEPIGWIEYFWLSRLVGRSNSSLKYRIFPQNLYACPLRWHRLAIEHIWRVLPPVVWDGWIKWRDMFIDFLVWNHLLSSFSSSFVSVGTYSTNIGFSNHTRYDRVILRIKSQCRQVKFFTHKKI